MARSNAYMLSKQGKLQTTSKASTSKKRKFSALCASNPVRNKSKITLGGKSASAAGARKIFVSKANVTACSGSQPASIEDCPLMQLPTELRTTIYEKTLEIYPSAHLIKRTHGNLASPSALPRVNRQIRSEFLSVLYLQAPQIVTSVRDFDVRHIVTFLNRLSEKEMTTITETASTRSIEIELSFTFGTYTELSCSEGLHLLHRWMRRLAHPTKKGTDIDAVYEIIASEYKPSRTSRVQWFILQIYRWSEVHAWRSGEAEKLASAFDRWEQRHE